MRQGIRALSWTITISMMLLFTFVTTAVYSASQLLMEQNIGFEDLQIDFTKNTLILTTPFIVNNTGYYDITEFNFTTVVKNGSGTPLVVNSTIVEEIFRDHSEVGVHSLYLNLDDPLINKTYLLFNDSEFKIDFLTSFSYAYAVGFSVEMTNTTIPWGAPLYNFSFLAVGDPSVNGTHLSLNVTLELENHSVFDINGTLHFEMYNDMAEYIGKGSQPINIPSHSRFQRPIEAVIWIENPLNYTGSGFIAIDIEVSMFDDTWHLGSAAYG